MEKNLLVLIHGFAGKMEEISPLKAHLEAAGYAVKILSVAGQPTTRTKMKEMNRNDWYRSIRNQSLKYRHKPLHMIGFSMGGLLAAQFVSRYQDRLNIKSITFLGTPVRLFSLNNWVHNSWDTTRNIKSGEDGMNHILQKIDMFNQIPVESVVDLGMFVHEAKKYISAIHIPTCIIQGEKDHLVHPSSAQWIYDHLRTPAEKKEIHILSDASHQLCSSDKVPLTAGHLLRFLERHA